MRARLVAMAGLFLSLGLACGGFGDDFREGFQEGMNEALVDSFSELQDSVLQLPHSPPRKRLIQLIERGRADAEAGRLELVDASVFVAEAEAAVADGELTMEEVQALESRYESMVSG